MYAGGGRMIEAPHTGAAVRIVPVRARGYWDARRY
jgi:cell wall-associated NlpC family hydrolase